ncbi:hypothetical protein GO495_29260 [Chitinophaga oryziterrae]|uniref:AraC family transcriptional regulator n=1 Tax=Chitinophaga oryziterrae TaxID=1031224 RepID=A0A6N8JKF1_9BACT|nr:hypothetical protein [Chitinophaga oryziterrae]MVT44718.1 hypothetical protein [Chitinophaga oryziterrae]
MKFEIADVPGEVLKLNDSIPLNYCNSIREFAKPFVLTSSYLDIMFHEHYFKGCALRNILFYVKQPVMLQTSISRTRNVIECMLSGDMIVQLNGQEQFPFKEGEYAVSILNNDAHGSYLQPGTYELLRCEFSMEIIKRLVEGEVPVRYLLDKYELGGSALVNKGIIWDELYALQHELKHTPVLTPLREEWFYLKLRELLVLTFEHDALILQKQ